MYAAFCEINSKFFASNDTNNRYAVTDDAINTFNRQTTGWSPADKLSFIERLMSIKTSSFWHIELAEALLSFKSFLKTQRAVLINMSENLKLIGAIKEERKSLLRSVNKSELSNHFIAEYKGFKNGKKVIDIFSDFCEYLSYSPMSNKAIAEFSYRIYKSKYATQKTKGMDYRDWYSSFCRMVGVESKSGYQKESKCSTLNPSAETKKALSHYHLFD